MTVGATTPMDNHKAGGLMTTPDADYWSKPCVGCGPDIGHTNLECVTQVAANVGMTVEEAMRVFVPQNHLESVAVAPKWTNWTAKAKPEDITNG